MIEAPPRPPAAEPRPACPRCGAPADPGQLACLSCGRRLGVAYRRPSDPRILGTLVAVLVVLLGAAAGFGLSLFSVDPPRTLTTTASTDGVAPPAAGGEATGSQTTGASDWPAGERAHTVVLSSSTDEGTAREEAKKAADAGIEDTGVLFGRDHVGLEANLFLVFAGRFGSEAEARKQAATYAGLGYGDAYPRLIEPR